MRFSQPLDDLLQSRSRVRVLRALVALPDEIDSSIREIARRAGVTHPTASAALEAFRQQGVVRVRRTLLSDEYRFNTQHDLSDAIRSLFDLEVQIRLDLIELLSGEIHTRAPWVTEASLFGSFAREEMRPDSDLDLALVAPASKANRLRTIVEDLSTTTVQRFGNPINAVIGHGSVQAMAQPGAKGYRLWRTVAKEGIPVIPAG